MAAGGSQASQEKPFLNIGEFEGTLRDEEILAAFRTFLRALDGKSKAAPEIKG